jgi:beta-lactamase regulating signal transducer with metallopeptidase domain
MSLLIQYLVKLSLCLAILWAFYHFVLRKLTFYNSNRWYLLGYSMLSFFIPFINISPVLEKSEAAAAGIIQIIPSVQQYTTVLEEVSNNPASTWFSHYNKWDWLLFAIITGALFLLVRFLARFFSFLGMRRKARLISEDGIKLYHVDKAIIPFSFGNAVFINEALHTETELQEIIRHEFVHVRQRHTVDIVWGELLCMINWYNPFAWLIKAAIRRNLEFIADDKVVQNGFDKKEYQYLLLKVIGNTQCSIANQFNFSSLKKRIAMMNKMKTTKIHVLRFLFLVPLLAVILVSFRQIAAQKTDTASQNERSAAAQKLPSPGVVKAGESIYYFHDTIPDINEKGYTVEVAGNNSNASVVIRDRNGKLVERIPFKKWKGNEKLYNDKYGELPPPPAPPAPPEPPTPPVPMDVPEYIKSINVTDKKATVVLKNGTVEKYDLANPKEKTDFENKYGAIIPPPPKTPTAPRPGVYEEVSAVQELNRSRISNDFEITGSKAHIRLKDGTVEDYDLKNETEKKKFETRYGTLVPVLAPVEAQATPVPAIEDNEMLAPVGGPVAIFDDQGNIIGEESEVLVTITRKTTQGDLENFIKEMKAKGIDLKIDDTEFENGILMHVSGTMKTKTSHCNFSATDFSKVILSRVKDGDRIYFQIHTRNEKQVS